MSAPNTNLDKQKRRHRGPLIGMVVVVVFALTLLTFLMMSTADQGTPADNGEGSIDGRTGQPVEADPPSAPTEAVPTPAPAAPATQP